MTAWVRLAPAKTAIVTRWLGTKMPLSTLLSERTRRLIGAAKHGVYDSPELELVRPLLELQRRWSALPDEREWLCERMKLRDGYYTFFYPFEGRLAHLGLATLFSYRLSRVTPRSFSMMINDYGFGLLSSLPIELSLRDIGALLAAPGVEADILAGLNAAELGRRQFREIARVAGLVFQGYRTAAIEPAAAGVERTAVGRVQHTTPAICCCARQRAGARAATQGAAARAALARMRGCAAVVTQPVRPTPFAFPLIVELFREKR